MNLAPGDGVRVVWYGRSATTASEWRMVFPFWFTAAYGLSVIDGTSVTAWTQGLWGILDTDVSTDCTLYQVVVERILTFETLTVSLAETLIGTNTAEKLPDQMAGLVLFPTAKRRGLLKKYIPGLCENNQAGGILTAGCLANLSLFGEGVLTTYPDRDEELKLAAYDAAAKVIYPALNSRVDTVMATQRRRKLGVGI